MQDLGNCQKSRHTPKITVFVVIVIRCSPRDNSRQDSPGTHTRGNNTLKSHTTVGKNHDVFVTRYFLSPCPQNSPLIFSTFWTRRHFNDFPGHEKWDSQVYGDSTFQKLRTTENPAITVSNEYEVYYRKVTFYTFTVTHIKDLANIGRVMSHTDTQTNKTNKQTRSSQYSAPLSGGGGLITVTMANCY